MLHVNASTFQFLFEFWQSRSHARALCFFFFSRLPFTVSRFIADATELLVHRNTSKYQRQWLRSFRISDFSFTMFLGFQNDFSYSDCIAFKKWWFLQFLTEKNKLFSISGICDINNKGRKISGVAWTLLDAQKHRMIMATRHKFSGLSLRLTAKDSFCMNTYSEPWRA